MKGGAEEMPEQTHGPDFGSFVQRWRAWLLSD